MNPQWIALIYVLVYYEDAMYVRIVENVWWKKTKIMNSRGLLVIRRINVLWIVIDIQCEGQAVRCMFWLFQRKMYAKYVNNQQR